VKKVKNKYNNARNHIPPPLYKQISVALTSIDNSKLARAQNVIRVDVIQIADILQLVKHLLTAALYFYSICQL